MAKINLGRLLEGTAYGVINEILAEFRSDDGFALPSRYEVLTLTTTRVQEVNLKVRYKCMSQSDGRKILERYNKKNKFAL